MPKKKKDDYKRTYGKYIFYDADGRLYARVSVRSESGKYKTIKKRAENITHVKQLAQEILDEYARRGAGYLAGRGMTFCQLADWYKTDFVIPPIYANGKKVAGMRTYQLERNKIDRLIDVFGKLLIDEIDEFVLHRYKLKRLKAGIKSATINREFETIRAMLRKAVKQKWIKEMIDFSGLIDKSLEERRTVTITEDQEKKILEAARSLNYAPRLYALIVALRDSGARPSELYPVNDYQTDYAHDTETFFEPIRWRDLFDEEMQIRDVTRLISYKGKIREVRFCVVTERMKKAFMALWNYLQSRTAKNTIPEHQAKLENLVFPETSYKKSWQRVREKTELTDLRLRDLRRDWSNRLARLGFSDRLAQRGMGHKQMQQTFEYTEFDMQAAMLAKQLLDSANGEIIEIENNQII